jgi:hypothetical protein
MDQDERKREVAGKTKPIPIREAVGEPGSRPARKSDGAGNVPASQAPGLRGQRERPEGPLGKGLSRKREGGGRRLPARKGAESGREERRRPQLEPTPLEDLPYRTFEHAGCEWIVRLCGQTSTGSAMDPGAPLMHLVFYKTTDPSTACGEALVPGSSLEGLPELRLPDLLGKARSAPSPNRSSG